MNISYKNLKREQLINLLENYEEAVIKKYNGFLPIKSIDQIPTIDQYLNSDVIISEEEKKEALFDSERIIAIQILSVFEHLLKEKEIYIPDKNRLGEDDEACIFGTTYYDLEDKITEVIKNNI